MILDEDMNDTLTELGEFILNYGPTKNSLWISYNSFSNYGMPPKFCAPGVHARIICQVQRPFGK